MKRLVPTALALSLLVVGARADEVRSAASEEVILDAPGGRPIGILLPGATRKMGEERDGFVRVTVEGWMRMMAPAGPSSMRPAAPAGPRRGFGPGTVSGRIRIALPTGEARPGVGARVLILGSPEDLEARRAELRRGYETERATLESQIESLQREEENALNSSESFREATSRHDRVRGLLASRRKEREGLRSRYAERVDDLFRSRQIAEGTTDLGGAFTVSGLPAGRYQVLAVLTSGETVMRWYVPVDLSTAGGAELDLGPEQRGSDPYFGTR